MLPLLLAQLIFGLTIPLHKMAFLGGCGPLLFVALRALCGGIYQLCYAWLYHGMRWRQIQRVTCELLPIIFTGIVLKDVCKYTAVGHLPVIYSASMMYFSPIITTVYSRLLLKTQFVLAHWIAVGVGALGALLFMQPVAFAGGGAVTIATCAAVCALGISAGASSYSYVSLHRYMVNNHYAISLVNGVRLCVGGVALLPAALAWEGLPSIVDAYAFLFWLVLLSIVSSVLSHGLYVWLLRIYHPTVVVLADLWGPLCAVLYGRLLLQEAISASGFGGLFMLCTAQLIFKKHPPCIRTPAILDSPHYKKASFLSKGDG